MINLNGKNILMFSPYGATKHYGEAIKTELINRGANVYSYDERPSQNAIMKIIIRLFKRKVPQIFDYYCKTIIQKNKNIAFDYILICRGEAFTPYTLTHLKQAFPLAKIILYFWDILKCADLRDNIPYCDKAMSFDPQDVEENDNLEFRPTFFINDYYKVQNCSNFENDIAFIGTLHSNRHKIIKDLTIKLKEQNISFYTYLYIPSTLVFIKDYIRKFPYISIKKVHFNPISISDTIKILDKTKAVFDINYTNQKSLSTRAYEAMASKRKYITTNPEVKNYDFYNPNNIFVVDLNNPIIPKEFLESSFDPIPTNILYHYSVAGLVDDLFKI